MVVMVGIGVIVPIAMAIVLVGAVVWVVRVVAGVVIVKLCV